jgi:hypothetical protein
VVGVEAADGPAAGLFRFALLLAVSHATSSVGKQRQTQDGLYLSCARAQALP